MSESPEPMLRLDGKTALVTGASQGIGTAVARRLAAQGARVVLVARNAERLEELAGELTVSGAEALALTLDLAAPEEIPERLGDGLSAPFDDVAILVNNAGITDDALLARMSLEQWQRVVATNLTGTFAVTRALARNLMRRRWGRIVSISSVVGLMGNAGQANYAASKAGLIGFSKSLARELGGRGVTVNVVAPGYVETAMTEAMPEVNRKELVASIALRRLGVPDDVAAAVAFLASEEAGYVTGQVLNVSGGLYI